MTSYSARTTSLLFFGGVLLCSLPSCAPDTTSIPDVPDVVEPPCEPSVEIPYDNIDQDCDGSDLTDVDDDGHGATEAGGDDCDDTNATVHPGATEIPYDGVDQDCDGVDPVDLDDDGYASELAGGDDCNDGDPDIHPGADDVPYDGIDQDCSGSDLTDVDGDGFDALAAGGTDCADDDRRVHPDAREWCDGEDNNCDGYVDDMVVGDTHKTIQAAMDAACADRTVWIQPGTYEEQLVYPTGKYIDIRGIGKAEHVIIDGTACSAKRRRCTGLYIEGARAKQVTLADITITGFNWAGVIIVESNVWIESVTFEGNVGLSGLRVVSRTESIDNQIMVKDCNFIGNSCSIDGGGGAYFDHRTEGKVVGSLFRDNTGVSGGGVETYDRVSIHDTIFRNNTAGFVGGGLVLHDGYVLSNLQELYFEGNSSTPGFCHSLAYGSAYGTLPSTVRFKEDRELEYGECW